MILKNGMVFQNNTEFVQADLILDHVIRSVIPSHAVSNETNLCADKGKEVLDVSGKYVIPGLIDIHTHGVMGEDASDGNREGMDIMAEFYASRGITSWCPTTMTLSEENLTDAMKVIRHFREHQIPGEKLQAACVGVHLEGPFLSQEKKGAQAAEYLKKPDPEMLKRLQEASGGCVRMVTVAPEEDEDFSFIKEASKICTVSVGHSAADYETASGAFASGATHVTHMYNGMNGIHHRNPGIIGAAFDGGASVELICDGLHIDPSVIRMTEAMFSGRMTLISDSMRCAGMEDGEYSLGGQAVHVKNGKATLSDGTLAGSSITLMDALRNLVKFGVPLEKAIPYATSVPASVIGMGDRLGSIAEGYQADLLILSKNMDLEAVILWGKYFPLAKD